MIHHISLFTRMMIINFCNEYLSVIIWVRVLISHTAISRSVPKALRVRWLALGIRHQSLLKFSPCLVSYLSIHLFVEVSEVLTLDEVKFPQHWVFRWRRGRVSSWVKIMVISSWFNFCRTHQSRLLFSFKVLFPFWDLRKNQGLFDCRWKWLSGRIIWHILRQKCTHLIMLNALSIHARLDSHSVFIKSSWSLIYMSS